MKVYKSRRANVDIPAVDLLTLLFESPLCQAQENSKIHVEAANPANAITKAEARELVKRLAYVLRNKYGIGQQGPGQDVVLTVVHGSPFAPILFYAIVAAGGIFSGASIEARTSDLVRQAKDGAAKLIVCSPSCEERILDAAEQLNLPRDRVLILDSRVPWRLLSSTTRACTMSEMAGKQLPWQRITDLQMLQSTSVCLLYSSGTTGLPKGVLVSHAGLVANVVCTMEPALRFQQSERGRKFRFDTIAHLPMANIAGVSLYSTNPFFMGGTTYWMEKYNFEDFIRFHRQFRPAYQFSVPPVWLRIAKSDQVTDHFDGLQVAVTGSAPIGDATIREVQKKLGGGKALLTQTWGTTETSGVITALDWTAYQSTGVWSVGELCPNVQLRIVDDNAEDILEPGTPGELLISGPIVSQGYHNRPQETRETFIDGWYHTGDIGILSKEGHVYIVDRKKELIKYKGAQVAPAELEAILTSHPEISDAAVIGVWSEQQQTELPRAYVVQSAKGSLVAGEVAEFVKSRVAEYKQLRGGVYIVPEIPKSAAGKILRKEVRAWAAKQGAAQSKL